MKPDNQFCPICSKPVEPSTRYPCYVCGECASKVVSRDGRTLIFFNAQIWAGFDAKYADDGEQYLSHDCYIDGVKCYADEAYFEGIVIQVVA
jgi:predicted nucleic acid-binding Zn ribbon protein